MHFFVKMSAKNAFFFVKMSDKKCSFPSMPRGHFFFFDERRKFCNTLVLRDFHQEKGLEAFLALYRRWFQQGLAKGLPTSGSAGGETTPRAPQGIAICHADERSGARIRLFLVCLCVCIPIIISDGS